MDVFSSGFGLSLLPFTLLLGHFHSAINPFVYWMINRRNRSKSGSGNYKPSNIPVKNVIEMRCEGLKNLRRESEVTSKIIAATEEKLKHSLGTSTSRRSEYFWSTKTLRTNKIWSIQVCLFTDSLIFYFRNWFFSELELPIYVIESFAANL